MIKIILILSAFFFSLVSISKASARLTTPDLSGGIVSQGYASSSLGNSSLSLVKGSERNHFSLFPVAKEAGVELLNPNNGEVFYRTTTDSNGSFSLYTKEIPEDASEFTLINITGGYAYWLKRNESNILTALVRTDSLTRGSVTVSIATTAAYLALEEHEEALFTEDYYKLYQENLNKVTRAFHKNVSEWPYETAYFNPDESTPIKDALIFDINEFMSRTVGDSSNTLLDIMAVSKDEQIKGLSHYFMGLNGWGRLAGSSSNSRTLDITFYGDGELTVTRQKNGQVVHEETLISKPTSLKFEFPTISFREGEEIFIKPSLPYGKIMGRWSGCKDSHSDICIVDSNSTKISVMGISTDDPSMKSAVQATPFDNRFFSYSDGYFSGKENASLAQINTISRLSVGERIVTSDGIYFFVDGVIIPETTSTLSSYKINVSLDHESNKNSKSGDYMRYIDYWRLIMGYKEYEPGVILPIKWNSDTNSGIGVLTGEIMYAKAVDVGTITNPPQEQFQAMSTSAVEVDIKGGQCHEAKSAAFTKDVRVKSDFGRYYLFCSK